MLKWQYPCTKSETVMCCRAREGVINECPLNHLFHNPCDVIITSELAGINIFLTVAVN